MVPFTHDQARLLVDASHQYAQWLSASRARKAYPSWMRWKTVSGKEYLVQGDSGGRNQRSLGPKSESTEAILSNFEDSKRVLKDVLERLGERQALLRAARLGRVLAPLAKLIRAYDEEALLGSYLMVCGTIALQAYEATAGYWLNADLGATEDLDLTWQPKAEISVREPASLLATLKGIDDTFTVNSENRFQVRNSKAVVVDFLTSIDASPSPPKEHLSPIPLKGQDWLFSCEPLRAIAIDTIGLPVRLIVPDPRMFALHKYWVSERADRNPLKVKKDRAQAGAVIQLIHKALPQYSFNEPFIDNLPRPLFEVYENHIDEIGASSGNPTPDM